MPWDEDTEDGYVINGQRKTRKKPERANSLPRRLVEVILFANRLFIQWKESKFLRIVVQLKIVVYSYFLNFT